ncbi:MAG: PKD domain-containing protein [Thermoplasmata archaeon]
MNDWKIGSFAIVPTTGTLWIPEIAVRVSGPLSPSSAPAVIFNLSSNRFEGIVPGLSNASAFTYDTRNGYIYAVESALNSVEVFDPVDRELVEAAIPVGDHPRAIGYDSENQYIFVANSGSNNVTVINGLTDQVAFASIAVGDSPSALEVDSEDGWVYVANANSSTLSILNAGNPTVAVDPISLPAPATAMAYSSTAGTLAVAIPESQELTILTTSSNFVSGVPKVGLGTSALAITFNGSQFVVANQSGSKLLLCNASTGLLSTDTISVAAGASEMTAVPHTNNVLLWNPVSRNLSEIDISLEQTVSVAPTLGPSPSAIAYDASLGRLFVDDPSLPGIEILNATTGKSIGGPILTVVPPLSMALDKLTQTLFVGETGAIVAYNASTELPSARNALLPGQNGPIVSDDRTGVLWDSRGVLREIVGLNSTSLVPEHTIGDLSVNSSLAQGMAIDPKTSEIFAINSTTGEVSVFNGSTGKILNSLLSVGLNLSSMSYDSRDNIVCAVGDELTQIDPATFLIVGPPGVLPTHAGPTGITFDPSRSLLYVSSSSESSGIGIVTVFNGSSYHDLANPVVSIRDGLGPVDLVTVSVDTRSLNGSDFELTANSLSGTVGLIGLAPQITEFSFLPGTVDVGTDSQSVLSATAGVGPSLIVYSGLPAGCASRSVLNLSCTPTTSGVWVVQVTVIDSIGDTATASATLNVGTRIDLSATFGTTIGPEVDVNQSFESTAFATGGTSPYTYSWTWGDGDASIGASTSHVYTSPGEYSVVVTATDLAGGTATQSSSVQVFPDPVSTPLALPSSETEVGVPIELNGNVAGGAAPQTARWNFGPGDTVSGVEVVHTWAHAGTFRANFTYNDSSGLCANYSVEDDVGSCQNLTLLIHVRPQLAGTFSVVAASDNPVPGTMFDLSANLKGGQGPYTVVWSFGGGAFATGGNVTTSFARAGSYTIWANATDLLGGKVSFPTPVTVNSAGNSNPSVLGGNFGPGLALGLFVGVTVAAMILFSVERSRRRTLPAPPSPYVPPPASGPGKRN